MRVVGKTDVGKMRSSNQDAYICGRLADDVLFAIVCDGMGGANGGNVASAMAIRILSERLVSTYREGMGDTSIRNLLESAIAAANVEIYDASMADLDLRGMGTTVVAVIAVGRRMYIAHVGDSRAYEISSEGMEQLTRDHSVVQDMLEKGQLTQTEARNHPRKHFITRALGVEETVQCDYMEQDLLPDSQLLLCTDGLTNMVETDDIYRIARSADPERAAEALLAAANEAGGNDNITVVLLAAD